MDSKYVAENLDKMVEIDDNGQGQIIGYLKGWVEVELPDGEIKKYRAKQLTLLPDQEKPDTGLKEGENVPFDNSLSEPGESFEVQCPVCENTWHTVKQENYKCKKCYHMFRVRLHPNKDNYIIGLSTTESGRDTMDINDDVAGHLRGLPVEDVYDKVSLELCEMDQKHWFSKANAKAWKDFDKKDERDDCYEKLLTFLWKKYSHLNLGMQRMNLGNLLRGAINRSGDTSKDEEADKE